MAEDAREWAELVANSDGQLAVALGAFWGVGEGGLAEGAGGWRDEWGVGDRGGSGRYAGLWCGASGWLALGGLRGLCGTLRLLARTGRD